MNNTRKDSSTKSQYHKIQAANYAAVDKLSINQEHVSAGYGTIRYCPKAVEVQYQQPGYPGDYESYCVLSLPGPKSAMLMN